MGFTDLISSSRGPGVIGTFVALIVLGGFATLYFLVFDESMQGGKQTVASMIRDQEVAIDSFKGKIQTYRDKEEEVAQRAVIAREVQSASRQVDTEIAQKTELTQQVAAGQAVLKDLGEKWEAYKDQYRAQVWGEAQGQQLKEFKTVSGKVYTDAKVLGVDHTGMRLMVHSGPVTVAAEELPDELRERYQLSEEKKKAILLAESKGTAAHEGNVEIATRQQRIALLGTSIGEKTAAKTALEQTLQNAIDAGPRNQAEISRLEYQIGVEKTKKISNAPQLQQQIQNLRKKSEDARNAMPKLRTDIQTLDSEMAKMDAEVKTLTEEIKKLRADAASKAATAKP